VRGNSLGAKVLNDFFTGEYDLRIPSTLLAAFSLLFFSSASENQETATSRVYRYYVHCIISTYVCIQCKEDVPLRTIHNNMYSVARVKLGLAMLRVAGSSSLETNLLFAIRRFPRLLID